jgi:hypothetical protein
MCLQDDWAWLPDDEDMFVPAKVIKAGFKAGETGKVKTEDGEVRHTGAPIDWPLTTPV